MWFRISRRGRELNARPLLEDVFGSETWARVHQLRFYIALDFDPREH